MDNTALSVGNLDYDSKRCEIIEICGIEVIKKAYPHEKGDYEMFYVKGHVMGYTEDEARRNIIKMQYADRRD